MSGTTASVIEITRPATIGTAVAIQAMTTFQAVIRERNEDTWDLLDLTGMGPRQVLRGLLLANLVQSQLYTAALAPFLVMAYLLRGIDLLTIAFALVVVPLAGVAASTLAVFLASIGNSKAARAFFGGLLGLGLVGMWLTSFAAWFELRWLTWFLDAMLTNNFRGLIGILYAPCHNVCVRMKRLRFKRLPLRNRKSRRAANFLDGFMSFPISIKADFMFNAILFDNRSGILRGRRRFNGTDRTNIFTSTRSSAFRTTNIFPFR